MLTLFFILYVISVDVVGSSDDGVNYVDDGGKYFNNTAKKKIYRNNCPILSKIKTCYYAISFYKCYSNVS